MFNKYKKYGIVKSLPFICFANINAAEPFISGKDNIKVVVNGETYVLDEDTVINEDKNAKININDDILAWETAWGKGDTGDYDLDLPENLDDNEKYKLVSFTIDDVETKKNASDTLKGKKYSEIKSGLTLKYESIYELKAGSKLSDGKNEIDICGTKLLYSDLKKLSTVKKLEEFIKAKFKDRQFGDNKDGCLKGIKVGEIDFNNFFIDNFVNNDKLDDAKVNDIVEKIKKGESVVITFCPYVNYTIHEIKLCDELAKTRKDKNINTNIENIKTKLKKSVKEIKEEGIKNIINTELTIPDDASTTYDVTLAENKTTSSMSSNKIANIINKKLKEDSFNLTITKMNGFRILNKEFGKPRKEKRVFFLSKKNKMKRVEFGKE